MAEPGGHIRRAEFDRSVSVAALAGFEVLHDLKSRRSHAVLLQRRKQAAEAGQ